MRGVSPLSVVCSHVTEREAGIQKSSTHLKLKLFIKSSFVKHSGGKPESTPYLLKLFQGCSYLAELQPHA